MTGWSHAAVVLFGLSWSWSAGAIAAPPRCGEVLLREMGSGHAGARSWDPVGGETVDVVVPPADTNVGLRSPSGLWVADANGIRRSDGLLLGYSTSGRGSVTQRQTPGPYAIPAADELHPYRYWGPVRPSCGSTTIT